MSDVFDNDAFAASYKFSPISINALKSLADQTIWFSRSESLNDPFEFKIETVMSNGVINPLNIKKKLGELVGNMPVGFDQDRKKASEALNLMDGLGDEVKLHDMAKLAIACKIKEINKGICVFSMSSKINGDGNPLHNHLLWAHYGDGLRGMCLEFDTHALIKSLNGNVRSSEHAVRLGTVNYVSTIPTFDMSSVVTELDLNEFNKLGAYKCHAWSYEQEIRLLKNKEGNAKYDACCLKSVYVGEKADPQLIKVVLSVVRQVYPGTSIYLMKVGDDGYNLNPEPLYK